MEDIISDMASHRVMVGCEYGCLHVQAYILEAARLLAEWDSEELMSLFVIINAIKENPKLGEEASIRAQALLESESGSGAGVVRNTAHA